MKKTRADARWNRLSEEQRQTLEVWLFEERLSYSETLERARKELGFKGSISSLRRFYENTASERMLKSMVTSEKQVREIDETPISTAELQAAGMKVVAQLFLNSVIQSPENMKDWSKLARLLLQRQSNEIRYRLKQEENELRREELEFEREKFQYDIMEQGVKVLPQLQELEERGLSRYEKNKRQNALRRSMWGPRIPEPLPENEEEEKEMARQEAIFQEERRKHHEEWLRRYGHIDHKAWRNKKHPEGGQLGETESTNIQAPSSREGSNTKDHDTAETAAVPEEEGAKPKYEVVRPYLVPFPKERIEVEGTHGTEGTDAGNECQRNQEGGDGGVKYPYGQ